MRMTRILACAVVGAMGVSPALAALSGYWDSNKIISAILSEDSLGNALRQQPIERITRTPAGFRVESRDCAVEVAVTAIPADRPGPSRFTLTVGQGHCT